VYVELVGVNCVKINKDTHILSEAKMYHRWQATFWRYVGAVIRGSSLERDVKQK